MRYAASSVRHLEIVVLLLGPVLGVALATPAMARVFNQRAAISQAVLDPCTHEVVAYEGEEHQVVGTTLNRNGLRVNFHVNWQGVSGTGVSSGRTYEVPSALSMNSFVSAPVPFPTVLAYRAQFLVVSDGGDANWVHTETYHVTVNAEGDVTVVKMAPAEDRCQ